MEVVRKKGEANLEEVRRDAMRKGVKVDRLDQVL